LVHGCLIVFRFVVTFPRAARCRKNVFAYGTIRRNILVNRGTSVMNRIVSILAMMAVLGGSAQALAVHCDSSGGSASPCCCEHADVPAAPSSCCDDAPVDQSEAPDCTCSFVPTTAAIPKSLSMPSVSASLKFLPPIGDVSPFDAVTKDTLIVRQTLRDVAKRPPGQQRARYSLLSTLLL
jgi:hypothetical protein